MNWQVSFSVRAEKFLERNNLPREKIFELIKAALQKFRGEDINIDIRKMRGRWEGFHRIRKGELRIIAEFNFDNLSVFIEVIDWRGGAYK